MGHNLRIRMLQKVIRLVRRARRLYGPVCLRVKIGRGEKRLDLESHSGGYMGDLCASNGLYGLRVDVGVSKERFEGENSRLAQTP